VVPDLPIESELPLEISGTELHQLIAATNNISKVRLRISRQKDGRGVIDPSSDLMTLEKRDKIFVKDFGKLARVLYRTKLWLSIEFHSCRISNIMLRSVHHRVRWCLIDTSCGVIPPTGPSHIIADTSTISRLDSSRGAGAGNSFHASVLKCDTARPEHIQEQLPLLGTFRCFACQAFYERVPGRRSSQSAHLHRVTSPETESNRCKTSNANEYPLMDFENTHGHKHVPKGLGFNWVTCPNYKFETLAWLGILIISHSWTAVLFVMVSLVHMRRWGWMKEIRHRKRVSRFIQGQEIRGPTR
ncbi:hypothetical protein D6D01_07804, partial [Aureobasidium pullulans]